MARLNKAYTLAQTIKLGFEAWAIWMGNRKETAQKEQRIKDLEKEIEELKKTKK